MIAPTRQRLFAFVALAALAGMLLLAWSQPWFAFTVRGEQLESGGDRAAGALATIALAELALIAALALAGPLLRTLLGGLAALLGLGAVAVAAFALADPLRAVTSIVAEHTGISGDGTVASLVEELAPTAWPGVALAAGVLTILAGGWIVVTARNWPTGGRRYTRSRVASQRGTAVDAWDALSAGEDPTESGSSSGEGTASR